MLFPSCSIADVYDDGGVGVVVDADDGGDDDDKKIAMTIMITIMLSAQ